MEMNLTTVDDCPCCGEEGTIPVPLEFRRDETGQIYKPRWSSECSKCGAKVAYDFRKALEEQGDGPIPWETICVWCGHEVEVMSDEFSSSLLEWPGQPPLKSLLIRHAYCEECEEGRTMLPADLLERCRTITEAGKPS